ncbi:ROK family transcriptional regulator [Streptomyces sp. 8L]|uniref:ROK family transcriptional regulator n=1 Tax=Streptomyces sp. 8L TaxID=2877242 RepID=UPI001CD4077E|nr:ROK family transcriptional regulator [Streptomyces sp. 8L]MCA1219509.1 ROK family transcriptional regulator [Streptomyces sp. 8L]
MAERGRRTVRDLRRGNRARVVQRLYFDGPLSRQELGAGTGLSSGSISNVVAELAAEGVLEEAGVVDSDGGRPRTLLRVAPAGGLLVGIDLGETRVRVELFDLSLTELARTDRLLEQHGYDVDLVVSHVRDGIADVLQAAGAEPGQLLGIGIGTPGIIESGGQDGAVVHGPTIGWSAVPFEKLLREAVEVPAEIPLFIDNGAKTLGQAEMWFGGGRGADTAAIALIGSGVGASVIHGGAPVEESRRRTAFEWGHTTVHMGGRRCRCGSIGCLEAYAGAEAMRERWHEAGGPLPDGADDETALAALLEAAFPAAGTSPDPVAVSLLDETAECLGAALADVINVFLPDRVLLGGWAGLLLGPHLLPAIRRHAERYSLGHAAARTTIEMGQLGPDAVTVGAATLPLAAFLARGGSRLPTPAGPPDGSLEASTLRWRRTPATGAAAGASRTGTAAPPAAAAETQG